MPGLSAITEFALAARAHDDALDLEQLAVGVARIGNPALERQGVRVALDQLAASIQERIDPGQAPDRLAAAFSRAMVHELGFTGDPELARDPRSSYIDVVLQRRTGLPILLSVVWILVGERLGVPLQGVNYPGHFLVCLDAPGARIYLDPFNRGALREPSELLGRVGARVNERRLLEPCGVRPLVTRMLANLKNLWVDAGDYESALAVVDRMLLISGDAPGELRDRGLLCLHLDRPLEARREFQRYLKLLPDAEDRPVIEALVARIDLGTPGEE